jgi:hypothetical protein
MSPAETLKGEKFLCLFYECGGRHLGQDDLNPSKTKVIP